MHSVCVSLVTVVVQNKHKLRFKAVQHPFRRKKQSEHLSESSFLFTVSADRLRTGMNIDIKYHHRIWFPHLRDVALRLGFVLWWKGRLHSPCLTMEYTLWAWSKLSAEKEMGQKLRNQQDVPNEQLSLEKILCGFDPPQPNLILKIANILAPCTALSSTTCLRFCKDFLFLGETLPSCLVVTHFYWFLCVISLRRVQIFDVIVSGLLLMSA